MPVGLCCCGGNTPSSSGGPSSYLMPRTYLCTIGGGQPTYLWNDGRDSIWKQMLTGSIGAVYTPNGATPFSGTHLLIGTGSSGGQVFTKNRGGVYMSVRTGAGTYRGTNATGGYDSYDCPLEEIYAQSGIYVLHLGFDSAGDVYVYADNNMDSPTSFCGAGLPSFSRLENWFAAEVATGPTTGSATVSWSGANLTDVSGTGPCCIAGVTMYNGTQTKGLSYFSITDGIALGFSTIAGGNVVMTQTNGNTAVPDETSFSCKSLFSCSITSGLGNSGAPCFYTGNRGNATVVFYDYNNAPTGITESNGFISFSVSDSGNGLFTLTPPFPNGCKLHIDYDGSHKSAGAGSVGYSPTLGAATTATCANTPWTLAGAFPGYTCSLSGVTS